MAIGSTKMTYISEMAHGKAKKICEKVPVKTTRGLSRCTFLTVWTVVIEEGVGIRVGKTCKSTVSTSFEKKTDDRPEGCIY